MAKTIVNNNIKLKSGGGFLNGVDGLEADPLIVIPAVLSLILVH